MRRRKGDILIYVTGKPVTKNAVGLGYPAEWESKQRGLFIYFLAIRCIAILDRQ
jgi:hypothetical protein